MIQLTKENFYRIRAKFRLKKPWDSIVIFFLTVIITIPLFIVVHQNIVEYNGKEDKMTKLHEALLHENANKVIVFEDTKHQVEKLGKELVERGFKAESIHGGKSQSQRTRALRAFKENKINILVATDVAARGIDVPDITSVINFSTPQTYDDYTHRIGRAGRAGRVGHALTFIEKY